ncbi:methionyl-tRNA formyltransferase [Alicyclobacillus tolerans]|uniref:methionyl-tRNA formyltransferase n=1 Tax=Alicyclobacillus tolerans TaxID=90970 RepID=UPI001F014B12|nr:methionyl-tRNA formyltransferase [Alicyclobacillus tolerans]MCF8564425.1 methionyl-tRNA formyltransferase [Alicyclobacillus tolerans]
MSHAVSVLFMGTPDFAVPSLEALVNAGYPTTVVTQPDREVGRKKVLTPPVVKQAAQKLGLEVLQPEKVGAQAVLEKIAELGPSVAITAAYGQILPQRLLDLFPFGVLNIHASLLPRWRGAAPIQRAIMAGDETTGVTLMKTVLALDAGPVLGAEKVAIEPDDDTGTLHDKLAQAGADLLVRLLPQYLAGELIPVEQETTGITYAHRIGREDEFVNWGQDARTVYNQLRALSPAPGASTVYRGQTLKIWSSKPAADEAGGASNVLAGTAVLQDGKVLVRCNDGFVELLELQPSGKRKMVASDWLRGVKERTIQFDSRDSHHDKLS